MTLEYFFVVALLAVAGAALFAPGARAGAAGGVRRIHGVTLALEIVFWASLAALAWTHLGYPAGRSPRSPACARGRRGAPRSCRSSR